MTDEEEARVSLLSHFVGYKAAAQPYGLDEAFRICESCWTAMQKRAGSAGCLSCRIDELELSYLGLRFASHMAHRALANKLPSLAAAILAEAIEGRHPAHLTTEDLADE